MVAPRYVQLFTDPVLVESRGVKGIFDGLAPTPGELDDAVSALSHAIEEEAPGLSPEFEQAAGLLLEQLHNGARLGQVQSQQREVGHLLERLTQQGRWPGILEKTGWASQGAEKFAQPAAVSAAVQRALRQADARTAFELEKLASYTAIPSVSDPSSLPNPKAIKAAEWVAEELRKENFKVTMITEKGANPMVYGELGHDPNKPTVLLYSHMDVQPVGEGWNTNPFRAFVLDGRLYGRGIADDKAGFQSAIAAVRAYRLGGVELPVNVQFIVEGEEEIGSPNLGKLLAKLPSDRLPPDLALLVDSENAKPGVPTVTVGLRGLVQFLLEVRTATSATHPGLKGMSPRLKRHRMLLWLSY